MNPDPGTVVDSVVTRPERFDFYLVPQFVNQGTVTPVCYNIIADDTGLSPDRHQAVGVTKRYSFFVVFGKLILRFIHSIDWL